MESSPPQIVLAFTEPLNRRLTRAALVDARSGRAVPVSGVFEAGRRLVLRPHGQLQLPDRIASVVRSVQVNREVDIGARSWFKSGAGPWTYETLGDAFDARGFFPWHDHVRGARLLRQSSHEVEVALADPGDPAASRPPFWFELTIDRATRRVVRMRMTAPGHFMTQRYFAFNAPASIRPPR